jgi:hypothetical protein
MLNQPFEMVSLGGPWSRLIASTRIGDGPAFLAVMADHGAQSAQCDLGRLGNCNVMPDEIERHIDACANFRHAFQMPGNQCWGRPSDAHDVTQRARRTKALNGAHAARTLVLGDAPPFVVRILVVTGARLGHYTAKVYAARR